MKNNRIPSGARHRMIVLMSVFIVIALIVATLPQSAHAAPKCVAYYTVQEGDTTPYIAHTFGMKWGDIALANDLVYPWKLKPGQRLCIPSEANVEALKESPSKGNINVYNRGNFIVASASSFPKKSTFYVNVRDITQSVGKLYKLGSFKVPKKGSVTKLFTLPKELRSAIWLQICTKEATTNKTTCKTVIRLYQ
jgi:LysM repeat protein